MDTAVLASTFLLSLLLLVGLIFFIKASVKDRIEEAKFVVNQPEDTLLSHLQTYFSDRAYQVKAIDAALNQVTFEGFVRPSVFLAVFLTLLAGCGGLCLALVLSTVVPKLSYLFLSLVLLSPLAGKFYWNQAGRPEQVVLRLTSPSTAEPLLQHQLTVTAHRDELAELQRALDLQPLE